MDLQLCVSADGPLSALFPLISRGWRPVGPVRRLRELSHCRQLGSSWPGLQPRCSSIGGQGSPVPTRWAIAGPRLSPPRPVTRSSLPWSVGPTHACQTAPSEHVGPPSLPHKLLLGTISRQISNVYLGGILVWRLSYALLFFGGYSGFGPFPSSEPSPRTACLQRITILAKYALRLSC